MTDETVEIPAEYAAFDYGFSAVDDPNDGAPEPVVQNVPVISEEVNSVLALMDGKLDTIINNMYRIEQTADDNDTEAELRDKIRQLEAVIIPLLNNLLKTADKAYIYWPDRKPIIEQQIKRVLSLTRG